jgi:NodT family efflux transporter outer membrane factor (OMF) lipoprotein
MVGPDYHPPQTTAPTAWAGVNKESASQPSAATEQAATLARWWQTLGDPKLTALVEEAMQANLDLQLAEASLRQARAQRGVVVGGLLPSVNGTGQYLRNNPGATGGKPAFDQNFYQAGWDAAWELDVFGGIKRNVESAEASVLAAQEGVSNARVSLAAEVALNYVLLRGAQQEILIARDNLKAQQHTADITRQKLRAGFVGSLDVANAEAQVATTEATIPAFERSAQQAIYTLSVLLARPPAALLKELSEFGDVPATPARIPVDLPSTLLRRRPDIRQAEAQLHAATAQIGVATADLFPQFSLTGGMNWQNKIGRDWFNSVSRSWQFGPTMNWAIFQGGSTISNIYVQEALRDQAFITYQKTVLTALQDVENALVALATEQQTRRSLVAAVAANTKAVEVSTQLYSQGETDFLNVLTAQRNLFASQDALVQSNRDVTTSLIALYKALGGGWEPEFAAKPAATSAPSTMPSAAPALRP